MDEALLKDHLKVGQAFKNQQAQNQELACELDEKDKVEEWANLTRMKCEVIKNLERHLVNAKKEIAELKAQVGEYQRRDQAEKENQPTQQEQQLTAEHPQPRQYTQPSLHTPTVRQGSAVNAGKQWNSGT